MALSARLREIEQQSARLAERLDGLDRLTDAKFVTYRTLIDSQAEKVKLALDAADKAVTKAEDSVNARLQAMNEFRSSLSDAATRNVSRLEFDQLREQFREELRELKGRLDVAAGRGAGASALWGYLIGAVGLVAAIVALVFRNM